MKQILMTLIRVRIYKWLIQMYQRKAMEERQVMVNLTDEGKIESAKLSIREIATYMEKEERILEKLERL